MGLFKDLIKTVFKRGRIMRLSPTALTARVTTFRTEGYAAIDQVLEGHRAKFSTVRWDLKAASRISAETERSLGKINPIVRSAYYGDRLEIIHAKAVKAARAAHDSLWRASEDFFKAVRSREKSTSFREVDIGSLKDELLKTIQEIEKGNPYHRGNISANSNDAHTALKQFWEENLDVPLTDPLLKYKALKEIDDSFNIYASYDNAVLAVQAEARRAFDAVAKMDLNSPANIEQAEAIINSLLTKMDQANELGLAAQESTKELVVYNTRIMTQVVIEGEDQIYKGAGIAAGIGTQVSGSTSEKPEEPPPYVATGLGAVGDAMDTIDKGLATVVSTKDALLTGDRLRDTGHQALANEERAAKFVMENTVVPVLRTRDGMEVIETLSKATRSIDATIDIGVKGVKSLGKALDNNNEAPSTINNTRKRIDAVLQKTQKCVDTSWQEKPTVHLGI
ncbi:MAG: hypothetical protein R3F23_01535 [Verrucomicrobiia bacterium]